MCACTIGTHAIVPAVHMYVCIMKVSYITVMFVHLKDMKVSSGLYLKTHIEVMKKPYFSTYFISE